MAVQTKIITGGEGTPPEPAWSAIYDDDIDQKLAHEIWGQVIREMREKDTLAVVNGMSIKRYVMACIMHEQAAAKVIEQGAVIKAKRTALAQYNPWWAVLKDADARAAAHESELGLSPRRRNAVGKIARGKKKTTAADDYLATVSK